MSKSNKERKHKSPMQEILSWVLTLTAALVIALLLNAYVIKVAVVIGNSMYPTLHAWDFMIMRQLNYTPENGDIVLIDEENNAYLSRKDIVKRVIATQGQTVAIDYAANTVTVDGTVLSEPYINGESGDPLAPVNGKNYEEYTVPEGCIFVMGDNRNASTDSRSQLVGMIPVENVTGGLLLHIPLGKWLS